MDQVKNNSMAIDLLRTVSTQPVLPKMDGASDFRKLIDKAAGGRDARKEEAPKAETPGRDKRSEAPVQKEENPLERIKKLLEQGGIAVQPGIAVIMPDGQVYQPGEYVQVWTETGVEFIPVTGLDDAQMAQLQQMLSSVTPLGTIDVSDPEADAMLEATDPTVDHSPAALLEKVVSEQTGRVADREVETVQYETGEKDDDFLIEITDAHQAPQPLFHDLKAAPVKVGEVDDAPEAEKADVTAQVGSGVAQALENGESMVRIQLSPENLGSVTVEISRSAEGIIRVALSAHSGETRSLLERHAGELQGLLSSRSQQSVEVNVQRQQESQQNQNHNYDGHSGHSQDGGQQRHRRQDRDGSPDFMQQLRLGLIPAEGEE